jgi:hypothetical protein
MKLPLPLLAFSIATAAWAELPPPPPEPENWPSKEDVASAIARIDRLTKEHPGGMIDDHDAFLLFAQVGYKKAVPVLISSLKLVQLGEDGSHECTWGHLLEALRAQTGKDFGFDQVAWKHWWNTEGAKLPESYFDPKKHQNSEPNQLPEPTAASGRGSS